jgi:xylulokinase
MALIGLDIGTSGCKASMFTNDGKLQGQSSSEYPVLMPHAGWAEQDIDVVWQLAQETLREVQGKTGQHKVDAIGLSVHGEAVTPIDKDGQPLRPMILGMDTRTVRQNEWLVQRFGSEKLFEWTGMPVHTINTLPKLLWIKQNEPEIWKKAASFMLVEDFLIYKMTGKAAISKCLASRTQLYDLHKDGWSETILQELELDPERLSPVLPSGTAVAPMLMSICDHLGFTHPPLVTTGGHDQACGALGTGLTRPGLAMVSTGTAEVVEVALSSPVINRTLFEGNISVYAHVVPGLYLAMTLNHCGGLLLRWFRDTLCEGELQRASQSGVDAYDLILKEAAPGPTSLLVLPHFSGSGTPWFDTQSKGAILGLTFSTRRADLAKAILEGLTYELRINLDLLKNGGVQIDSLRAIGGGAKSDLWLQLKADITGIPVVAPEITEAAGFGAAILAGAGAGIFSSAANAAESFLSLRSEIKPQVHNQQVYNQRFELYRQVYPAVKQITHQL